MKNFKQKYGSWALVTGATAGIGAQFSEQLAKQGLNIVAVARNQSNLDALKLKLETKFHISVKTIAADLSKQESNQLIIEQTNELDIGLLVANAGAENNGLFIEIDESDESQLLALNVVSPMILSHAFAKRFVRRGKGGILLLSSLFGYQGVPFVANYSASKAYILTLGEALNVELKPLGVDVTVLSPGLTKTSMTENMTIDFNKVPITSHSPEVVAKIGLNALGKKATVVPGLINKIYAWENRFIPRTWPVNLFGFLINRAIIKH
ncbi:MAG: SDR family NAD(P)-dependent oxidoreductase [Colwellia sp.]|nr:SDR family NAD(P)-dependent oxidoreductase [Colwellia sp.]